MGWESPHSAKVIRRIADAPAEVVVPETICNTPPSQRILVIGQPVRQSCTSLGLVSSVFFDKTGRQLCESAQRATERFG